VYRSLDFLSLRHARVSDRGEIEIIVSGQWKPLPQTRDSLLRKVVYVPNGGPSVRLVVASVVLRAFGQPPPSLRPEIVYADGDKSNCRLSNLSWRLNLRKKKETAK